MQGAEIRAQWPLVTSAGARAVGATTSSLFQTGGQPLTGNQVLIGGIAVGVVGSNEGHGRAKSA
jgi:hypothetical protein